MRSLVLPHFVSQGNNCKGRTTGAEFSLKDFLQIHSFIHDTMEYGEHQNDEKNIHQPKSSTGITAFCHKHNRPYDPESSDGCVLCTSSHLFSKHERCHSILPRFFLPVLILLFFFGAGYVLVSFYLNTSTPPSPISEKIDPETEKDLILQIEDILYDEPSIAFERGAQLEAITTELAGDVRSYDSDFSMKERTEAFFSYSSLIGSMLEVGYGGIDIETARREWEKLRDSVFTEAEWFRSSSPLSAGDDREVPLASDAEANSVSIESFDYTIRRLESLLALGKETGLSYDAENDTGGWDAFRDDWDSEIEELRRIFPDAPLSNDDEQIMKSYIFLTNALLELSSFSSSVSGEIIPDVHEREAHLDLAGDHIKKAREHLMLLSK